MPAPLLIPAIAAGVGAVGGYLQYRKGMKEAKRLDEMGLKSMAEAQLPEYKDVEARYKQISEQGLGSAETNEFMRRAQSAQYAQQLAAQTMAGGSLARYTLALNNAQMISGLGTLAAQNFQRKMQGLTGYERQLGVRQGRTDADIQMENQRRLAAGQAAAGLAQQGGQNMIGALTSFATSAMTADTGGTGVSSEKITDTNYGDEVTMATPRPIGVAPVNLTTSPLYGPAMEMASGNLPVWTNDVTGARIKRKA